MNIAGPGSENRWSIQIGDIPELSSFAEAWGAYLEASNKADAERDEAIAKATTDCENMKRELACEILDNVHHQYHQEDT